MGLTLFQPVPLAEPAILLAEQLLGRLQSDGDAVRLAGIPTAVARTLASATSTAPVKCTSGAPALHALPPQQKLQPSCKHDLAMNIIDSFIVIIYIAISTCTIVSPVFRYYPPTLYMCGQETMQNYLFFGVTKINNTCSSLAIILSFL